MGRRSPQDEKGCRDEDSGKEVTPRTRKAVEMRTVGRRSPQDEKGCRDEDSGKEVTSGRERLWR